MIRYFILIIAISLLTACQSSTNNQPSIPSDTTTKQSDISADTMDSIPPEATKADEYYGKSEITNLRPEVMTNVTSEYTIMDTCTGDLNTDAYPDLLLILKRKGEDSLARTVEDPIPRPLLIFTGQADKTYKLADRSENAVYCVICGGAMGDPYTSMIIKKGYFSIEYYGGSSWRWTRTITFKYSPSDSTWYLHKDGYESFSAMDPNGKRTVEILTVKDFGKVPFNKFDIEKSGNE